VAKNQMVDIDWSIPKLTNFDHVLKRFKYYLNGQGHSESTIENYIGQYQKVSSFFWDGPAIFAGLGALQESPT